MRLRLYFLVICALTLSAQTASVLMQVKDPLGNPAIGATISLIDERGNVILSKQTNAQSEILWENLPVGKARFKIKPPFAAKILNVNVLGESLQRVPAALEVDGPDTIPMPDNAPLLKTEH